MPERFELTYQGEDNAEHRPVMIHRALLGSMERFAGILIEHYGGRFPAWLAPVQAAVLPVSDRYLDYAREVAGRARRRPGVRVRVDERSESVGPQDPRRRAREARRSCSSSASARQADGSGSVRSHERGDLGAVAVDEIPALIDGKGRRSRTWGDGRAAELPCRPPCLRPRDPIARSGPWPAPTLHVCLYTAPQWKASRTGHGDSTRCARALPIVHPSLSYRSSLTLLASLNH